MLVRSLKDIKIQSKSYKKGEVFETPPEALTTLKGIVEPLSEEEALEYKIGTVKLPIYIKEYKYLNKALKDVLIISNEQLKGCLRNSEFGEVFKAYLMSESKNDDEG